MLSTTVLSAMAELSTPSGRRRSVAVGGMDMTCREGVAKLNPDLGRGVSRSVPQALPLGDLPAVPQRRGIGVPHARPFLLTQDPRRSEPPGSNREEADSLDRPAARGGGI